MSIESQGQFFTIYFTGFVCLCFTRPRYQVSIYRTIGPLVLQRSFRKELFDDAIARMTRACIKTNMEIEQFKSIQNKVQQLVIQKQKAEVDYGDIPDEFRGKYYIYMPI